MITFSDGSSITLRNGENGKDGDAGVTPLMKIDEDGFWCVSYDGGKTYETLTDPDGKPLFSRGADGTDGICVRIIIDESGCYAFELYAPNSPDVAIETISTPYTADPASVLQSVVEDDSTGIITLTLADGRTMTFNLDVTYPTGILVLTDKVELPPSRQTTFEFRINPSNARFVPVISGNNANLQLDMVGTRTAQSYVTAPENYRIVSVERSVNADGEIKAGQYTATVEDTGKAAEYSENAVLVLTTKDGRGEQIQLSSSLVEFRSTSDPYLISMKIDGIEAVEVADGVLQVRMPYGADLTALKPAYTTNGARIRLKEERNGTTDAAMIDLSTPVTLVAESEGRTKEYRAAVIYSDFPVIYLNTPTPITSKTEWTAGCTIDIWNAEEMSCLYEAAQIKGRGNSTWTLAKKPYAIKLDSKAEVLGMPKHKRWVLLANQNDKSALRTEISFFMGRMSLLEYTPRIRYAEVVMNGKFQGLYQVTEQLKADKNRVNVDDDGFLLEIDARAGEDPDDVYFRIPHISQPLVIKAPDVVLNDDAYNYIKQYATEADEALFSDEFADAETGYRKYLDVDSFVDWYLINEITRNYDAAFFSSCYMHLKRGNKLKMGPLWDFDLAISNYFADLNDANNPVGFWIKRVTWYTRLFSDPYFVGRVKERFNYFYENRQRIYNELQDQRAAISEAVVGNEFAWNRYGANGNESKTVQLHMQEVEKMQEWLETRFNWMKSEFDKM